MTHRVTLKPSGHSYQVDEGKTVLQAGLDAGYMLPYSCRAGVCRTCRGTIVEGSVDYGAVHATYLPDSDKAKGYALLCQAKPLSSFDLREECGKPVVMVASGTGFAPIKSICELALEKNLQTKRPMTLYWGCRIKRDLYMLDIPQAWERPGFKFVPVLSEPTPECQWTGRTGFVHRAVMQDFPDMAGVQVYACGAPIVIESARRDFSEQCRLPAEEFYADSFLTEADKALTP